MRLLLDESLPVDLRRHLPGHHVSTVGEMGWAGLANGVLLARAARQFDVLLTADQNMRHQQNLSRLPLSVVVLASRSNALSALLPLLSKLNAVLLSMPARTFAVVTP